jgi:hypothetical protein
VSRFGTSRPPLALKVAKVMPRLRHRSSRSPDMVSGQLTGAATGVALRQDSGFAVARHAA